MAQYDNDDLTLSGDLLDLNTAWADKVKRLEAVNADLLAALRRVIAALQGIDAHRSACSAIDIARAAIAKAQGGV